MKNTPKTTTNSSAAENLYQARMGPNSNNETHNLDAQTSSNCFEMKLILCIPFFISQFNNLLFYLCPIVNKKLAHVI